MEDKNIAFIDIGTNSIRLLLTRVNKSYTILSEQKETVRLGEDEFRDRRLRSKPTQRAVLICKEFAEMARANHAEEIVAVATSATREAINKKTFLHRLRKEAGLDVHPIAGLEEARLIYLGVVNGIHLEDKRALIVDIGGGSTEVIVGDQDQYHHLESLKLGAIRLATYFLNEHAKGKVDRAGYQQIQDYVRNSSVRAMERLREHSFDLAYGSSGTIENLGDIAIQMFAGRSRAREDTLRIDHLEQVIEHLCGLGNAERAKVPGINPRRADIIIPGAAILHTLMRELDVPEIHITDRAMREGMLVDYLMRHGLGGFDASQSVRMRSVMQLARRTQFDEAHAVKVAQLSLQLFDSGKSVGLHALSEAHRELLHYAALLHDIGIFLSYDDHQAHSYYLIKHADLVGFDQNEISIVAAAGYFHRKSFPSKKHPQFAELGETERDAVRVLAILLRLAEALDRGHKGIVDSAHFRQTGAKEVALEIECAQNWQLEQWGLRNHYDAFRKAFGRELAGAESSPEVPDPLAEISSDAT